MAEVLEKLLICGNLDIYQVQLVKNDFFMDHLVS